MQSRPLNVADAEPGNMPSRDSSRPGIRRWLFRWPVVVGLVLGLCLLCAPAMAQTNRPALRWGADAEGGAPYIFKDAKDVTKEIGFEVDIIQALSRELKRPIEHKQYDFKSLVPGLERDDFDFAMNGLEVTPDRQQQVRFSRPYYVYRLQLVVRADETRIKSLEDCARIPGIQVGTLDDTAADRLLDKMQIPKRIYDSQYEPYEDLELGRVDAVLLDLPIAQYFAHPNPKFKYVGEAGQRGFYAIAFRFDEGALADEVDEAIGKLIDSGKLKEIYERWNLWNDDQLQLKDLHGGNVMHEAARAWTFGVYFPHLWDGAKITVRLSVLSMSVAVLLGLLIAVCRLYGPPPVQWLALGYVEFFRGIPVLLLLFFIYFALPGLAEIYGWGRAFRLSPITAAIIAFGMNYAAFEAEIYRSGIGSIPRGQWEAAASLGMNPFTTFRRIILPQAIRIILPPTTNDFVALFKDTSLVSVVSVIELTKQYQILSKSSQKYLEIGLATAMLYLIMSVPLGMLSREMERRWGSAEHGHN